MQKEPSFEKEINYYFQNVLETIQRLNLAEIETAMHIILDAYEREADIYCFGNGGSAATASHMCNDFNKGISYYLKKKFRMHCLNDNIATVMAIANDADYSDVFSEQLKGTLRNGDLVIAISGSGNSANIIKAVEYAQKCGCKVIGLSGYDGGKMKKLADYNMYVPINNMQVVEDVHLIFNHMMMSIFSKYLSDKYNNEEKVENI